MSFSSQINYRILLGTMRGYRNEINKHYSSHQSNKTSRWYSFL